jgi:hypothetical protein
MNGLAYSVGYGWLGCTTITFRLVPLVDRVECIERFEGTLIVSTVYVPVVKITYFHRHKQRQFRSNFYHPHMFSFLIHATKTRSYRKTPLMNRERTRFQTFVHSLEYLALHNVSLKEI